MNISIQNRFRGCLAGLAVGDALGALFEAQSAEYIRRRFPTTESLVLSPRSDLWYTDDTQMAIGVAEALIADAEIVEERLCEAFVANYMPNRGYGRGARAILDAMEDGEDYRSVAASHFPGGSFGNGAAMRVAPVGLMFRHDLVRTAEQARLSALPTHLHPLGIEGAQLIALAVALSSCETDFNRSRFVSILLTHCQTTEFQDRLNHSTRIENSNDLLELGNGIQAIDSVVTAITCFWLTPDSFEETIANAIFLGGDTDTIAAMAGAISGAYLGLDRITPALVANLEDSPKGRDYILNLADRLFETNQRIVGTDGFDT